MCVSVCFCALASGAEYVLLYSAYRCMALRQWCVFIAADGVLSMSRCYIQRTFSHHKSVLTNIKKIRDRYMHQTRHKHGRRSYLSDGIGGDSQSLLERDPLRSKDRGLFSYNIEMTFCNTTHGFNDFQIKRLDPLKRITCNMLRIRECVAFENNCIHNCSFA